MGIVHHGLRASRRRCALRNGHAANYTEAQGYLIACPMPAAQVAKMLAGEDDRMPFALMQQRAAG